MGLVCEVKYMYWDLINVFVVGCLVIAIGVGASIYIIIKDRMERELW